MTSSHENIYHSARTICPLVGTDATPPTPQIIRPKEYAFHGNGGGEVGAEEGTRDNGCFLDVGEVVLGGSIYLSIFVRHPQKNTKNSAI